MNYKILKELVSVFKKKLRCNQCNKSIANREINIEAINLDKVFFKCKCSRCKFEFFAEVSILKENHKNFQRNHNGLKLKAKTKTVITSNDILDVKNFLKSFKGDFKEIFRK